MGSYRKDETTAEAVGGEAGGASARPRDHVLFQPSDRSAFWPMPRSEMLQRSFNRTRLWSIPKRNWLFKRLVKRVDGNPLSVFSPPRIDNGGNTTIGKNFFANGNLIILDHGGVTIGFEQDAKPIYPCLQC